MFDDCFWRMWSEFLRREQRVNTRMVRAFYEAEERKRIMGGRVKAGVA